MIAYALFVIFLLADSFAGPVLLLLYQQWLMDQNPSSLFQISWYFSVQICKNLQDKPVYKISQYNITVFINE